MTAPYDKKIPFAKAFAVLGIGACVGVGLCGVGFAIEPSTNTGFMHWLSNAVAFLGMVLFYGSLLGMVIACIFWIITKVGDR
jgi:hypothetical protein